jgi:serine/threonine protein kinase, bacterial
VGFQFVGDGDEATAAAPADPTLSAEPPKPVPTPARKLPQPNFQGTFAASFGPPADLGGSPVAGGAFEQTWAVEPVCADNGCRATASLVGGGATSELIFDQIDGRWVGVSATAGTNCHDDQDQRWVIFTLKSASDTSLTGDWQEIFPIGSCATKRSVTFTRTGDVTGSVDDPTRVGPRVVSPAAALRGTYKYEELFDDHHHHKEFTGETFCTHDGTNCLSYLFGADGTYPMTYVDGKWSVVTSDVGPCGGGTEQILTKAEYPLPQPPQNPITTVPGHASRSLSGACNSTFDFDVRLTAD